ncbi:MAG: L-lysine 6-transaminase [Acidimicrobiia bacterium]|nr:L-lysine 6-transaminase [Acidimicrobiia bacterium]
MMGPNDVHAVLAKYQLTDGYPIVLDLERSEGVWLFDSVSGKRYLDAFSFFASWPMGYRHPMLLDAEFQEELLRAATTKTSNSDVYTVEMARFVEAFATRVTPEGFPHHFWVSGGALGVENALKTAFDWKARKIGRTSFESNVNDLVVLHLRHAFHGRTGYTLSVTNTRPDKTGLYPKFDWPRVHNPAIEFDLQGEIANDIEAEEQRAYDDIDEAYANYGTRIAAILIEPMQGEGGDNHFRGEFLAALRTIADERDSMLVFDEVQTGFFGSGKPWMWQHFDVKPDLVAFGKKTQVCGFYASERVDEVVDNVFSLSSRINSTWGGNLVDMVRCRRFIEICEQEDLSTKVAAAGDRLIAGLRSIAHRSGVMSNIRGRGSLVAFTVDTPERRGQILGDMFDNELMALPCGPNSIRFRLPFVIQPGEIDEILNRTEASLRPPTRERPLTRQELGG